MNFSPHTFELTLVPKGYEGRRSRAYENAEGSHRIFKTKSKSDYYDITFDEALVSDGIRIEYHDTFLKPHIRFIVNPSKVLGGDDIPKLWKPTDRNLKALLRKLKAHIKDYFDSEYKLNDFKLTRMDFTANIDVSNRANVSNYIKLLHSLGKVKGFNPKYKKSNKWIDKALSFDLIKKTPLIEFSAYDKEAESNKKEAKGILRVEVRLMRMDVRGKSSTSDYIIDFSKASEEFFMKFFEQIVPRGDYYNKKQALALIEDKITAIVPNKRERENTLERMKALIELIPKKKSLRLAQKALEYRDIDRIMTAFAECNVSPVTIPKSMNLKHLESLYSYLEK